MRRFAACLVLALVLPAAAAATSLPPSWGVTWPKQPSAKQQKASCSEQGRTAKVARVARKLDPVACEQPPRPKVRIALPGSFLSP